MKFIYKEYIMDLQELYDNLSTELNTLGIRLDKNIYQGFDFTGDHDPNRQAVWVLGVTYSSENKMLPYLHSGKCYFQFAKYAP